MTFEPIDDLDLDCLAIRCTYFSSSLFPSIKTEGCDVCAEASPLVDGDIYPDTSIEPEGPDIGDSIVVNSERTRFA